jgi:hypothetical protein
MHRDRFYLKSNGISGKTKKKDSLNDEIKKPRPQSKYPKKNC